MVNLIGQFIDLTQAHISSSFQHFSHRRPASLTWSRPFQLVPTACLIRAISTTSQQLLVGGTKFCHAETVNPRIQGRVAEGNCSGPIVSYTHIAPSTRRAKVHQRNPTYCEDYNNDGYRDCHALLNQAWCTLSSVTCYCSSEVFRFAGPYLNYYHNVTGNDGHVAEGWSDDSEIRCHSFTDCHA